MQQLLGINREILKITGLFFLPLFIFSFTPLLFAQEQTAKRSITDAAWEKIMDDLKNPPKEDIQKAQTPDKSLKTQTTVQPEKNSKGISQEPSKNSIKKEPQSSEKPPEVKKNVPEKLPEAKPAEPPQKTEAQQQTETDKKSSANEVQPPAGNIPAQAPKRRDLKEIVIDGNLKILMLYEKNIDNLPKNMTPSHYEQAMLINFAKVYNVQPVIVYVDSFERLFKALDEGKGDIVAANVTVTEERKKNYAFTLPIDTTAEQIVTNARNFKIKGVAGLVSKNIFIEKGTCYWENMQKLQQKIPSIRLFEAPEGVETQDLLARVETGKVELAVADSNFIDAFDQTSPSLKVVYEFPERRSIAWVLRKDSSNLQDALNQYLKKELPEYKKRSYKGDLDDFKKMGVIRILTRNNPTCYYVHRGVLMGFEYELAKEFAKRNGLRPIIIVPNEWVDLFSWLAEGRGDLIAANLSATERRKHSQDMTFCEPYSSISKKIVARMTDNSIKELKDLKGRTVVVRKNSSYWETLQKLRNGGLDFNIMAAPEEFETFEIIRKVASGAYDLTVADETILNVEKAQSQNVKGVLTIGDPDQYAWMVRKDSPQLKSAVDAFFKKEYKSVFFNTLYNKYFNPEKGKIAKDFFVSVKNRFFYISPYDKIIKKHSQSYDFHWCLIASQIFHESRFEPDIQAWDGGMGLMQLMPKTAAELGCRDPFSPDDNVSAGVKYMSKLRKKMDSDISAKDKLCFALASYNGGYGHLLDARKLALQLGLDPDKWYGNVEKAMMLLSTQEYASRARFGYCAAPIIVNYVNGIMLRYYQYREELERCGK